MSEGRRPPEDVKPETASLFPLGEAEGGRTAPAAEQTPPPGGVADDPGFETDPGDSNPASALPTVEQPGSSSEVRALNDGEPRARTSTSGVYAAIAGGGLPEPGELIFDRYIVIRKIGEGGMGSVWLVQHKEFGTERALKLIASGIAMDPQARARFRREARIMDRLNHINAVAVHDFRLARDAAYIEMEFVRGPSLNRLIQPGVPMPLDWTARILDQLCDVLQAAHEQGITHRDLKPSNLMLLEGRPAGKEFLKVLDFGIAKIRDPDDVRTQTGNFIGTAHYSSPEQVRGDEVDGRSDIYSVGVILYELLTGHRPFIGPATRLIYDHLHSTPPPFADRNPEAAVPEAVERVVLSCLEKDPARRPQSAHALAEAFQHALAEAEDEPSVTRFDQGAQTTAHWAETSPAVPEIPAYAPGPEFPTEMAPPSDLAPPYPAGAPIPNYPTGPAPYPTPYPTGPVVPVKPPANRLILPAALVLAAAVVLTIGWIVYHGGGIVPRSRLQEQLQDWASRGFEPESPKALGWPNVLIRKADGTRFLLSGRFYLPEGYEPSSEADLDDWPKALTRSTDQVRFIRIPGDSQPFTLGRVEDRNWATAPAEEGTPVRLDGFYIQEREVSNGEVARWLGTRKDFGSAWRNQYQGPGSKFPDEAEANKHPAVRVNWELARAFARAHQGRLPSEAQWEYTARSRGLNYAEVWGWNPDVDRTLAINYLANIDADPSNDIATWPCVAMPGEKKTDLTFQGVHELAGNVREWTRDRWKPHLPASREVQDDPGELPDPQDGGDAKVVVRGGSFATSTATRYTTYRSYAQAKDADADLGFRIVIECPEALRAGDVP